MDLKVSAVTAKSFTEAIASGMVYVAIGSDLSSGINIGISIFGYQKQTLFKQGNSKISTYKL